MYCDDWFSPVEELARYAIIHRECYRGPFKQPSPSPCRGSTTTIMPNNRHMNPRLMEDVSGLLQREQSGLASAEAALDEAATAKSAAQAGERTAKRVCTSGPCFCSFEGDHWD